MRGGAATPSPRWIHLCQCIRPQHPGGCSGCPVFLGESVLQITDTESLRGRICPRCHRQFFLCRHCDRGHVYCCRICSLTSRLEKCRIYRRRHRRSPEGRLDHRDSERARRNRLRSLFSPVGDHTSDKGFESARVSAPTRMAAVIAALGSVCEEETQDNGIRCEICGSRSAFVRFDAWTRRCSTRRKGFRLRL